MTSRAPAAAPVTSGANTAGHGDGGDDDADQPIALRNGCDLTQHARSQREHWTRQPDGHAERGHPQARLRDQGRDGKRGRAAARHSAMI